MPALYLQRMRFFVMEKMRWMSVSGQWHIGLLPQIYYKLYVWKRHNEPGRLMFMISTVNQNSDNYLHFMSIWHRRRAGQSPRICRYYQKAQMSYQRHSDAWNIWYTHAPFSLSLFTFSHSYPVALCTFSQLNTYFAQTIYSTVIVSYTTLPTVPK